MNVVVAVVASVVVCSVVGASAGLSADAAETPTPAIDDGLGGDISVFMQRGAAETNGSVDSGMWLAAFDTAENQSRKRALVRQRAAVLGARLDRLERRIDRFSPSKTNRSVAERSRWVRLVADRNALRTSITDAKTTAASEGVNATELDRLGREAANLTVPQPATDPSRNATNPTRGSHDHAAPAENRRTSGMTYGGP